jgi:hypothetical protein
MRRNLAFALILVAACAKEEGPSPSSAAPAPSPGLAKLVLKADPGEALPVLQAKEGADGDVLVAGRVGQIVQGFASFRLVDASLAYCGAGGAADDCPTPWDYCCIPKNELTAATLVVEARDADGKPLRAGSLPGLRLLDLAVVRGKLTRDAHGNVVVLADGWFRRERPDLREGLRWPE